MTDLEKARIEINQADEMIAKAFEKRMLAVQQVALYKQQHNLPVFDKTREDEVIKKNLAKIKCNDFQSYYNDLLVNIMRISKEYQCALLNRENEK